MIDAILLAFERNLDYARRLVADLPDAKMAAQPVPGAKMNHAAWVLGHLARTTDFIGSQFGLTGVTPAAWADLFGGSSKPDAAPDRYPNKATLLAALEEGHRRVADALRQVDSATLNQPPAAERLRARFPTVESMLIHMCVAHEQVHLGQLSAWRRAQSLPAV
jgi:uncharacterized damage-inducible protein DinB